MGHEVCGKESTGHKYQYGDKRTPLQRSHSANTMARRTTTAQSCPVTGNKATQSQLPQRYTRLPTYTGPRAKPVNSATNNKANGKVQPPNPGVKQTILLKKGQPGKPGQRAAEKGTHPCDVAGKDKNQASSQAYTDTSGQIVNYSIGKYHFKTHEHSCCFNYWVWENKRPR